MLKPLLPPVAPVALRETPAWVGPKAPGTETSAPVPVAVTPLMLSTQVPLLLT